jgi:acyl-coenzyme A synthetase/AMP-(fatty) acid ligase
VKINERFYFQGRANNDVVKNMGTFINLSNIETVILQNRMVEQAAVSLYENDQGHDELGAVVVPAKADQDTAQLLQDLQQHLAQCLSSLERPKSIKLIDQIPRTDNGKISRALVSQILTCTTF